MPTTSRLNKNYLYVLLVILLLAIILRLFFFTGYNSGDDRGYIAKAYAYTQKNFSPPVDHWSARAGIVVPTAISYAVFGVTPLSTVLTPFLLSVLSIPLIFFFAAYLFDVRTGLLSAFLLAIFPMDVFFASTIFPNEFLSFFTMGSLFSFIFGIKKHRPGFVFTAGLLLGIAYLCHITALYCLLFFGLFFIFHQEEKKHILFFGGGLLLAFAGEMFFSYILFDDALTRFNVLLGKVTESAGTGGRSPDAFKSFTNIQWVVEPFVRFFFEQEFGLFYPLTLAAVFYQLKFAKDKNADLLLLWIIPIFLYLAYGTTSPAHYNTLRRLPRYYSLICGASLILLAFFLTRIQHRKATHVITGMLVVSAVACLYIDNSKYVKNPFIEMVDYIDPANHEKVIIDRTLIFDYLFFTKFKKDKSLVLLVNKEDSSNTLDRIKLVFPQINYIHDLENGPEKALVVLGPKYYKPSEKELQNLKIDHTITQKNRLYYALFDVWPIRPVIELTRDPKRFNMLLTRKKELIKIYEYQRI